MARIGCCPVSAGSDSRSCGWDAKFEYYDHNPVEHRERVIINLRERDHGLDAGAATQQQRRLTAIGDWRTRKRS